MSLPRNFIDLLAASSQSLVEDTHQKFERLTESPIEATLATALFMSLRLNGMSFHIVKDSTVRPPNSGQYAWVIAPQQKVGAYRLDFVIGWWVSEKFECVVVECDGHDFHERTKEQASRDRRKDRDLQDTFKRVLRFTGSDIYRDAFACAEEIIIAVCKLHDETDAKP